MSLSPEIKRTPEQGDGAARRAVFLDRDGVLNANVFYADTGAWEAPRSAAEFAVRQDAVAALAELQAAGFLMFVVSNQPNVAKGKAAPGELDLMHAKLVEALARGGVTLTDAFYCVHHPAFTGPCVCRKPSPHFLLTAAACHSLALAECWMLGDRATDMQCGRAAGVRTAWIVTGQEAEIPAGNLVDLRGESLAAVTGEILR